MKVFIVGGTGFIGYYATKEFISKGHKVATISLRDIEIGDWFPKDVEVKHGNIFEMPQDELVKLFTGYDAMVYAVGPDDRFKPSIDAYAFFHERLVVACGKVVEAAKLAGVKKCVVLNSYFAYFDRIEPHRKLAQRHPYIKCRVEQADHAIELGGDKMAVMILELPYIFGTMPERTPLWKDVLVEMLYDCDKIYYPKGGTNMICVEHVAEAVVAATEKGVHGKRYPIGDVNMDWVQMLRIMLKSMGMGHKKITTVPTFLMNMQGKKLHKKELEQGKYSGLDARYFFGDIQCKTSYFDPSASIRALGYRTGGIEKAIDETVKKCLNVIVAERNS